MDTVSMKGAAIRAPIRSRLKAAFFQTLDFLVRHDSRFAPLFVRVLIFVLEQERKPIPHMYRVPAKWLDRDQANVKRTLAPEYQGYSFGPLIANAQRVEKVRIPAVKLYDFDNAYVSAISSSVMVDDRLIIERTEGVNLRRCSYAQGHIMMHGRSSAFVSARETQKLDCGIFLAGNGSGNYYHWMIEILPKLEYLSELDCHYGDFPLLVCEDLARIRNFQEALAMLVNARPIVLLDKSRLYDVGKLVYINAPNICPFNFRPGHQPRITDFLFRPSSIEFMRNRLSVTPFSATENMRKRIFFDRKGERRRYNDDEVFAAFERHGFTRVYMEELSLASQIELISNAEMIAGPTGASWTNLIFCRKGTRCLCWMAEESREFAGFSNLARIVGADLHYVTYRAGTSLAHELYSMDYRVDAKTIANKLDELVHAAG